jgi:hypothetical protein
MRVLEKPVQTTFRQYAGQDAISLLSPQSSNRYSIFTLY